MSLTGVGFVYTVGNQLFPVELKVKLGDTQKQLEDLRTQQSGSVCVSVCGCVD